ncbi:MAG: N-acetylneuraminate lyase [Phycisphaerales bacterium]|jgi:N-acetylneuraminate lyase|nr:N-acetylneuraminate lyase [Phycisphaerales bacterium]
MTRGLNVSAASGFALAGLIAAPHTPLRADGELNLPVIEKQAALLIANGISAAFICGTTGEGMSLTVAERMQVAQRWVEVCGPSLGVIVHTGHNCLRDASALASHAQQIGASATSALPPMYFKPGGVAQTIACAATVAAAAPELPFYYYHIPGFAGFAMSVVDFLQQGRERIPNLRGVKFTHPDLMEYQRCLALAGDDLQIAWGVDEHLLGGLAVGARAAVGSTYNYTAPVYHRMMRAFAAGDLATARQAARLTVDLIAVLLRFGGVRTGKAIMSMIGVDVGPPRPPFEPLTKDEMNTVRREYEALGFFEAISRMK